MPTAVTGAQATERRPARRWAARWRSVPAAYWALGAVLAVAVTVRVLAVVAIYPGIWFTDSDNYIYTASTGTLKMHRVMGYSLLVAPFWHLGSAAALIIFQHLLGLGIVGLLFALLRRRGVPAWLAVLAVVPAALDAYVLAIEHAIMSDTLFDALVVSVIALLLWRDDRPGIPTIAAAGLLLGYAGLVRSVGAPFVAVFVVYLALRRVGWRALIAFVVPWALVTAGYAALFDAQHGKFALNQWGGRFLYAQVAPFADCSRLPDLPADERAYCPDPNDRWTSNGYLWSRGSPIGGTPPEADGRIRDFALRVIRDQPLRYARVVTGNLTHYFAPGREVGPNDYKPTPWQFPANPARGTFPGYRGPIRPHRPGSTSIVGPSRRVDPMVSHPRTNARASRVLRRYQQFAYTSGQLLLVCLLVVAAALVLRRGEWRLRLDAALLASATVTALVVASALSVFSFRYALTGAMLLPPAAALAGAALLGARRSGT